MKYPTGVLENAQTNRFHPISFRCSPAPSGPMEFNGTKLERHKSLGHHTEGFDTIEEAQEWIKNHESCEFMGDVWLWDGTDIPAMVQWIKV